MPTDSIARNDDASHLEVKLRSRISKVEAVLSGALPADKFIETAVFLMRTAKGKLQQSINNNPGLFMACCYQAAMLGLSLDPMLGEFYVVPRKGKPTSIIGYIGLVKRVRRIPEVANVRAAVVRDGDQFDFIDGTEPSVRHVPALSEHDRPVLASWACIDSVEGPPSVHMCDRSAIEKARSHSESANSNYSPWVNHYDRMAMKTALRRLCKLAPLDEQTRTVLATEELRESESFVTQLDNDPGYVGLGDVIDAPANEEPTQ